MRRRIIVSHILHGACGGGIYFGLIVSVVLDLASFRLAVKDNWVIETRRRKLELQMFEAKQDEITTIYFLCLTPRLER